ncbi:MAG: hypothetical protein E6Q88_12660, partial [Lysobacteraceae bacterium]
LEWVWPDTMPNDDVVTQAVTLLRKAFGDSRDQNAYIETIAKHGYRLVAPVEWILPEQTAPETRRLAVSPDIEGNDTASGWRRRRMAAVAATIIAIATSTGLYVTGRLSGLWPHTAVATTTPAWPDLALAYQRIASTAEPEMTPSLSPDGALVVYSRYQAKTHGATLMLQPTEALPAKPITATMPGRIDTWPVWSPDGKQIAFVRNEFVAANEHRCTIMLISAVGGGERELARCLAGSAHPINWYPYGSALIASNEYFDGQQNNAQRGIHRLPLPTGRWEPIDYALTPAEIDTYPAVSPDGRWIAFYRNSGIGGVWKMSASGGKPQLIRALPTLVKGLAWTPDGEHLIFSQQDRSGVTPASLSRIRHDGAGLSDDVRVGESMIHPSMARASNAIAFEIEDARMTLRKTVLDQGESTIAAAERVFDSSLSTLFPSISPDGKQIVFLSNRSGVYALWWAELARADSLRPLEGIRPATMHPVVWDASSTRILAIGETSSGHAIFEIEPRIGRVHRLPFGGFEPLHAAYHPDPGRLFVVSAKPDGETRLSLHDRGSQPWRELAAIEGDVQLSVVDHGGERVLFARLSKPEIWQADLRLREPRLAGTLQEKTFNTTLTTIENGAWVLDSQADCGWYLRPILRPSPADDRKAICLGRQMPKPLRGVSYDPTSGALYFSTVDRVIRDIGLLAVPVKPDVRR